MTIEEAIQHCKDEAAKLRKDSAKRLQIGLMHAANDCEECATEHEQLAEWLKELKQRREAEITAPPKSNDEHTAAYWMQKTMDAAHEAYDRLKDTVDFKNAIAEAEAIKQRMGIGEKKKMKKITNGDRIRQMKDEELVREFSDSICNIVENCEKDISCYDCKMQWLKQEVSEDAPD